MPSVVDSPSSLNLVRMSILQICITFIDRKVTVRRRANKYKGTCACVYPWLVTRMLPRDVRENLHSRGFTDLKPTCWSTAHKPHTPGWATQTASPSEHRGEIEHNVCTTPGQITVYPFTKDAIQDTWPELQTAEVSSVHVLPKKSFSMRAEPNPFRNEGENLLTSRFSSSMDILEM